MPLYTYIDTHAHLCDEAFSGEEEQILEKAAEAGIKLILQPDIDSSERDRMFALEARFPSMLKSMAGLYPGSVTENWEEEVNAVEKAATSHKVVAIGEIGLDYHYSKDTAELQKAALKAQFEIAAKLDLPVNIHERDATDDFFKVLDSCKGLGLKGNMHAFSGSYETFMRLQKYGEWLVGIGGVVTFKNAGVAESVKKIPLSHIVLETDSPYLAPVPFRGKRNDSSYIPVIAEKVALQKGISLEEVAETTTANACRLFNLETTSQTDLSRKQYRLFNFESR